MTQTIDFKSAYEPTDFVKQIYDIQHNRLLTWRNRYSKEEYPYKVAMNTVYQLLTCELMWDLIINSFSGKISFDEFSDAYSFIQSKSGEIAKGSVLPTLESKYKTLQKISILDMNSFRNKVIKAQKRNNEMVKEVERAYIWYTGAVELIYGWVAFGLTGKDIQQAVAEMCGILIGGNYTEIDIAITNFGQIIDTCKKSVSILDDQVKLKENKNIEIKKQREINTLNEKQKKNSVDSDKIASVIEHEETDESHLFICSNCKEEIEINKEEFFSYEHDCPKCGSKNQIENYELIVEKPEGPRGIGGWLWIPAIGLVLYFLTLAGEIFQYEKLIDVSYVPSNLVSFGIWKNIFLAIFLILFAYAFYGKRKSTPTIAIIFLITTAILNIYQAESLSSDLSGTNYSSSFSSGTEFMRTIMVSGFWILYFALSKRVKNTFIK